MSPTSDNTRSFGAAITHNRHSPYCKFRAVPISAATMRDGFWRPRMVTNYQVSIPGWVDAMEEHGVVDNFRRAAGHRDVPFRQSSFGSESDLYKWMEAGSLRTCQSYARHWTLSLTTSREPRSKMATSTSTRCPAPGRRWRALHICHALTNSTVPAI